MLQVSPQDLGVGNPFQIAECQSKSIFLKAMIFIAPIGNKLPSFALEVFFSSPYLGNVGFKKKGSDFSLNYRLNGGVCWPIHLEKLWCRQTGSFSSPFWVNMSIFKKTMFHCRRLGISQQCHVNDKRFVCFSWLNSRCYKPNIFFVVPSGSLWWMFPIQNNNPIRQHGDIDLFKLVTDLPQTFSCITTPPQANKTTYCTHTHIDTWHVS